MRAKMGSSVGFGDLGMGDTGLSFFALFGTNLFFDRDIKLRFRYLDHQLKGLTTQALIFRFPFQKSQFGL